MSYQVKVKSSAEREAKIKQSVAAAPKSEPFFDFRSQKMMLPVIRIDLDLPIYRMENFRTFIDQKEYIARENKPKNFFLSGQENESAQQIQHEVLARLARQGRADSVVPVIDVLRRERQREPILITHRGIVVNGNRRLAALRELYAEDAAAYGEFRHVDCLVLPEDATLEEIVDIEAALQAKPETRLDYDWVGDCQLIKKLLSLGRKIPEVAERLNRKKSEITNSLAALAEADLFLKEWAKAEGDYGRVKDAEQFFKDLPSLLEGKDATLQEASRMIAWTLFENREELGERLYNFNVAIGKRAADVVDKLATELGVATEKATSQDDGGFAVDLDEEPAQISYQPVADLLRDKAKGDEAVETLIELSRNAVEAERGQKTGNAALKAVTAANAKLAEVDLSKTDPKTYTALGKQLDSVLSRANDLRKRLDKYVSEKPQ